MSAVELAFYVVDVALGAAELVMGLALGRTDDDEDGAEETGPAADGDRGA